MNKLIHGQQIIFDKIVTVKHTITGQDYARSILKATTDEIAAPKKKHLDYLVRCTDDPTMPITEMCRLLLDRAHNQNWPITFKALITIHELMNYGNERFFQYLASDNSSMNLDNFSDRTDGLALHMSKFVRAYGKYVSSKAISFRIVGYDFCKVKRGAGSFFSNLKTPKLFEGLSRLQIQIDDLLRFDVATVHDLSNCIIRAAYNYSYRDLVRLMSGYNDGMGNLLQKYFDMDKKNCQEALIIYKKYPAHVKMLQEFLKEAVVMFNLLFLLLLLFLYSLKSKF
ncbi:hypothetical protein HELRODRAFT_73843 [Helobdella robusta]|uniref:ENTH domain-containing protein n=1 Tax=Helobdella robusta TaxID=6412 RepID=T1G1J1_HELRO|nr:hypothetical protein HELRODRAFT_73843 [Helobdella robusta]ESO09546.1 hypothetical protein HELRODRAFT_73843 [Helobdella robusta]